jgi:hypothetical protein
VNTTQRGIFSLAAAVVIAANLAIQAQTQNQATADSILQPVPPADIPESGTFYRLSDYLDNGGSLGPPLPFLQDTNATVYSLNDANGVFLVDNTSLTNDTDALNAAALLLQPKDSFSANLLGGMAATSGAMAAMDASGNSGGYTPMFDPTSLWLEITNVRDGVAYLNLHNATNQVYAIWSTTNLPGGWNVESELWPTNSAVMPFTELSLDRQNLFLLAEDWTGVTENGNTTPDWWFWMYFDTTALYDTNLDTQGNTLLYDSQNGLDPNIINFTVRMGNEHFNATNATGSFLVMAGVPSYESVLVNSTNFGSANWTPYDGTIHLNLGSTDGVYQVWMGLKGRASNSLPTWIGTSVYLDQTPPLLRITNPAPGIVMQPYIQVQGLANERLSAVTYDISNALTVATNLTGTVTGEFLDTNLLAFTTNYFQCYDAQVTNGVNLITVHATDWAGNTTSTNLSYTLDYTGKTNPPAIKMTWPLGGEDIAQNSITVYGTLSDPTATISLQVTDTNGNSNAVSGLVERDGHFWIQNVPLSPGSNWLSLTAQDVVSNTITTNLTVTENNTFRFTINPVTSDLWAIYATVSGSLSDSNYTVTVNGVAATVDASGNWTATNVPNNPANIATFQAKATSPGGGDPGVQSTIVKQPEITLSSATWNDEAVAPLGETQPQDGYSDTVTTWSFTAGRGGTWHQTGQDVVPGAGDSSSSDATINPDGSVPYLHYQNSSGVNTTNEFWPAAPWVNAFDQEVGSLTVIASNIYWETTSGQASWVLHEGISGVEQDVPNLVNLTGHANNQVQGVGLALGQIQDSSDDLPGPEITNTGQQENGNHQVYLLLLDGATTAAAITPDTPLARVSNTLTNAKPYHQTEYTAPADTNLFRTSIGVGEYVHLGGMPAGTIWSVSAGGLSSDLQGLVFVAPSSAASVTVTATYSNLPIPMTFTVFPPTGVTVIKTSEDTFSGPPNLPPIPAAGMWLLLTYQPTSVSFYRVQVKEISGPPSNVQGYFTNFTGTLYHNAADWTGLSSGNQIADHAFCSVPGSLALYPGSAQWVIPDYWRVGGTGSNFLQNFQQGASMDSSGNMTVTKLGQSVTTPPH